MTRRLLTITLCAAVALAAGSAFAAPRGNEKARLDLFPDFHAGADGPVFMATDPAGAVWAVWSYRHGLETDIAVSRAVGRTWTAPQLLGTANGLDDLDPRIAFMPNGEPVVAWWQDGPAAGDEQIVLSRMFSGTWSPAAVIAAPAKNPNFAGFDADGSLVLVSTPCAPEGQGGGMQIHGVSWAPVGEQEPDGGTNGPDPMPTIIIAPPRYQN